jgi:hypothetical protein
MKADSDSNILTNLDSSSDNDSLHYRYQQEDFCANSATKLDTEM